MKHLKIIILIISAAVFVAVSGCKKHDAVQNTIHNISGNFLDSVIGNYSCIEHYFWSDILSQNGQNTPVFGDSTIGPVLLSVQASSDSAVIINGVVYSFYSATDSTMQLYGPVDSIPSTCNFKFTNDSIYLQQTLSWGASHEYYYYYTGHKR